MDSGESEIEDDPTPVAENFDARQETSASSQMDVDYTGRPSVRAPIWKHFRMAPNDEYRSLCKYCNTTFKIVTGSTTSMIRHLQKKHSKIAAEFNKEQSRRKAEKVGKMKKHVDKLTSHQLTLQESFGGETKWSSDNPKSITLTKKIGIWMAKSLHPYSLVEEEGLKDVLNEAVPKYTIPSRTTFSRNVIPQLYDEKRQQIMHELQSDLGTAESISLTSDLWTSRTNDPYLALTLHYMSETFSMKRFCLGNEYCPGEKTAECISDKICMILNDWDLASLTIPIYVVTDNGKNISKAVRDKSNWTHLRCFAHTLQLALKDAKNETPGMNATCAKARAIVGHYKRSSIAQQRLHEYQAALGKKRIELIQDCETRWNSEFAMLSRLVDQKEAVSGELLNSDSSVENLSMTEWKLAQEYVEILQPLDEATRETSANKQPTSSLIYPHTLSIENDLETRITEKRPGIMFSRALLRSIKTRFAHIKTDNVYKMCTSLDPRFKCSLMQNHEKQFMTELLVEEALKLAAAHKSKTDTQSRTPETSNGSSRGE